MERLFYKQLLDWKTGGMTKPLLVMGARQVGKSYIVDAFCKAEYNQYIQIDLLKTKDLVQIYQSDLSSSRKFEQLQMLIGSKLDTPQSILFVDEVQESEEFISDLKYLQEDHPEANIICAGSLLGVKLKRFKRSFPVGKVNMRTMYPMNFPEFLMALGKKHYIPLIKQSYQENSKLVSATHTELLHALRVYLCIGGMPEAVKQYLDVNEQMLAFDSSFFDDLRTAYLGDMKKYVANTSEAVKIERIYSSIPLQQANKAHKFQYSKIKSGARAGHFETALDWLMAADLIYKANCITNPEKPMRYFIDPDVFKLFINDVGILTHLLRIDHSDIILDRLGQHKGLLAENYVACELETAGMALHYWRSDNNAEVDFLIENKDGVIPLEVKSADNVQSKSLRLFCEKFNPPYAMRISTKNFGFENKIKSVPLYAAFCLEKTNDY